MGLLNKKIMWSKIVIVIVIMVLVIVSTSETDPLCSEGTRLKEQDYQRWLKAGGKDCKIYSNKILSYYEK